MDFNIDTIFDEMYSGYINENCEILTESLRDDYIKKKFKNKYLFKPDKNNPNKGTITVDGVEYTVMIPEKGDKSDTCARSVRCTISIGKKQISFALCSGAYIYLPDDFWRVVGDKAREATLQHEIGHMRYNLRGGNYKKHFDKDTISLDVYKQILKDELQQTSNLNDDEIDKYINSFFNFVKDDKIDCLKYLKNKKILNDNDKSKLRLECLKYINKKYPKKYYHDTMGEVEADLYAINKTGRKAFISTMTQAHLNGIKDAYKMYKNGEVSKSEYEQYKQRLLYELKKRIKYSGDKELIKMAEQIYK